MTSLLHQRQITLNDCRYQATVRPLLQVQMPNLVQTGSFGRWRSLRIGISGQQASAASRRGLEPVIVKCVVHIFVLGQERNSWFYIFVRGKKHENSVFSSIRLLINDLT